MKLQLSFPKIKLEESAFSIKGILSIAMCHMHKPMVGAPR